MELNLPDRFSRYTEMPNLMKTHPVGAKFFMWVDRHDEANSCFSQTCLKILPCRNNCWKFQKNSHAVQGSDQGTALPAASVLQF
jgi:hypothetical protein